MNLDEYLSLVKNNTHKPIQKNTVWAEDSKLCVVYAEFRNLDIIPWNLYNLANVYGGTDASLTILHSGVCRNIILETIKDWKNVKCIQMTEDQSSVDNYNLIFTNVNFWKLFEKHEFILLNQWDSYIFRKIPDKFFNFDYVGAPTGHIYVKRDNNTWLNLCSDECKCGNCRWKKSTFDYHPSDVVYSMMNGGFSLRKVSAMIDLCSKKPYPKGQPEDVYFCLSYLYKPSIHEAKEFSVQGWKYDDGDVPVGCHKIWENEDKKYILKLFGMEK